MPVEHIIQEILKIHKPGAAVLVSLCGWADTGKTTLAEQICSGLRALNIESDHISTDSFMPERAERNRKGISGYHTDSLKKEELLRYIARLRERAAVKYYPYDNRTGRNAAAYRTIEAADVIVIEGIHSFNEAIRSQAGLLIYIDAPVDVLEELRFHANIKKRGFAEAEAGARIKDELEEYFRYISPGKKYAQLTITVDGHYNYAITSPEHEKEKSA